MKNIASYSFGLKNPGNKNRKCGLSKSLYEWIDYPDENGLCRAKLDGETGYVDTKGNWYDSYPVKESVEESVSNNTDIYKEAEKSLKSGKNPADIFDDIYSSGVKGVAVVELGGKMNLLDRNGKLVPEWWIDIPENWKGELDTARTRDVRTGRMYDMVMIGNLWNILISGRFSLPVWPELRMSCDTLDYFPVKNGKSGYIDKNCEMTIPCKYTNFFPLNHGLLRVESSDKRGRGICNLENGKLVLPTEYMDIIDNVATYMIRVIDKNGKQGFFDARTMRLTIPCKYESAHSFEKGIAAVKGVNGWGVINEKGDEIVPCEWEIAGRTSKRRIRLSDNGYGDSIIVDPSGKKYDGKAGESEIRESVSDNGNDDVYKEAEKSLKSGKKLTDIFDDIYSSGIKGIAVVELGGKMNLLDRNGKPVWEDWVDIPDDWNGELKIRGIMDTRTAEMMNIVIIGDRWNVISPAEKSLPFWPEIDDDMLIRGNVPSMVPMSGKILKDGKYGYVDAEWNVTVPCEYDDMMLTRIEKGGRKTYDDRAYVIKDGKWGYVDLKTGKLIIPCEYDGMDYFDSKYGISRVGKGTGVGSRLFGMIRNDGKIIVPCEYLDLKYPDDDGYIFAYKNVVVWFDTEGNYYDRKPAERSIRRKTNESVSDNRNDDVYKEAERRLKSGENPVDIFDDVYSSGIKGVAVAELNDKMNLIDRFGKTMLDSWVDVPENWNGEVKTAVLHDMNNRQYITIMIIDKKWNIIKPEGHQLPFWPDTGRIIPKEEDTGYFYGIIEKNGKCGYVNEDYKIIVPCEYYTVAKRGDGYIMVVKDSNSKNSYGLYDSDGSMVAPCVYNHIGFIGDEHSTLPGLFEVERLTGTRKTHNRKTFEVRYHGYIDTKGNEVIPCIYTHIGGWIDGIAPASTEDWRGYIDTKGNRYNNRGDASGTSDDKVTESVSDNGNDDVYKEAERKLKSGKSLLEIFDDVYSSGIKGVAVVELGGKMNIMSHDGKLLMDRWAEEFMGPNECGLVSVRMPGKRMWTQVSTYDGQIYDAPEFRLVDNDGNNYLIVRRLENSNNVMSRYLYGIVDNKGKLVVPCEYEKIVGHGRDAFDSDGNITAYKDMKQVLIKPEK